MKIGFKIIFLFGYISILLTSCNTNKTDQTDELKEQIEPEIDTTDYEMLNFNTALDSTSLYVRHFLEFKIPEERYSIEENELYSSVLLPKVYTTNNFNLIWLNEFQNTNKAFDFMDELSEGLFHGLDPYAYHYRSLNEHKEALTEDPNKWFDPIFLTHFDLLLSDAFFMYSSHLYHGKINPEDLTVEWGIQRNKPELKLDEKLLKITEGFDINELLKQFYPKTHGYELLVKKAKTLFPKINDDVKLKLPETSLPLSLTTATTEELTSIQNRLIFLDFTDSIAVVDTLKIINAVKTFQKSHGLNQDGKIGTHTLAALNVTTQEKLSQIFVNLERLRWLPEKAEVHQIHVNIANFNLLYLVKGDTIANLKTVVGRDFRQTPVFSTKMTYLVFSPTWTVPPGILRNDILPEVAKNINYLTSKNMVVLDRSGRQVDVNNIDWQAARRGASFPYMIRQLPGNQNALGRVKFMFPNKYNVYIHDTPSKSLFAKDERIFSSGCIRVEKPDELATLILKDDEKWDLEKVKNAMNRENELTVGLKHPIQVYIYYLTAWGEDDVIHFRRDIYNRDAEVLKGLKALKN